MKESPGGTTEQKRAFIQSSLRDSIVFTTLFPSTEVLGYFQSSLTGLLQSICL